MLRRVNNLSPDEDHHRTSDECCNLRDFQQQDVEDTPSRRVSIKVHSKYHTVRVRIHPPDNTAECGKDQSDVDIPVNTKSTLLVHALDVIVDTIDGIKELGGVEQEKSNHDDVVPQTPVVLNSLE